MMRIYKKTFILFFFLLGFFLLGIIAFNYYVDPANQFYRAHQFTEKLASLLLDKKEVLIGTNYNERLLQKKMLEKIPVQPEILVLGSSHSIAITQDFFNHSSFYNASVSGADLEDDMALYYIFLKRGWQPKTVILCVDPWILDKDFALLFMEQQAAQQWRTTLAFQYTDAKKLFLGTASTSIYEEKLSGFLDKYSQLLSVDFLKSSIKKLVFFTYKDYMKRRGVLKGPLLYELPFDEFIQSSNKDVCPSCYTLLPDGSRLPSRKEETATPERVELDVAGLLQHIEQFPLRFQEAPAIDATYANIFEHFIQYLQKNNVTIIFYFSPLAPKAYTEFVVKNPKYRKVNSVEQYFLAMAAKYNIKVVGGYEPTKLGLQTNDFFDASHLKREGIKKIFIRDLNHT
jgi:hypothetical protein